MKFRVKEVEEGMFGVVELEIDGQEAMLALVEQEMLEIGWGSIVAPLHLRKELTDSEVGEHIMEAWFEE